MFTLGFLIYTFNRIDDARINMELVRNLWQQSGLFKEIRIVHAFNGNKDWYPKEYLEDDLVRIANPGHFQGAAELIDAGAAIFQEKYPNLDYIIVVAADSWLLKPDYVAKLLDRMSNDKRYIATCAWGNPNSNEVFDHGVAVDFFIYDPSWAVKYELFPVDYKSFANKYLDLILYRSGSHILLEKLMVARFAKAVFREDNNDLKLKTNVMNRLLRLEDREPVHDTRNEQGEYSNRKPYWEHMGLVTHHDPAPKREILKMFGNTQGDNISRLLNSPDLTYYNNGAR